MFIKNKHQKKEKEREKQRKGGKDNHLNTTTGGRYKNGVFFVDRKKLL